MARKAATAVKEAAAEPAPSIMAIKGFDADLRCSPNGKPFQFEIGGTYKIEGKVTCCENGFHAVDPANPLHVWDYYPPIGEDGRLARYADVVMTGATDKQENERGTKIAAAEIMVKAEITLPDFIKRAVTAIVDAAKGSKDTVSSGRYAQLAASGYSAKLAASGDSATLAASGNYAKLAASGKESVIAASAPGCVASGAEGTWISLAEFRDGKCIGFATGCIGKDGLKPNTAYRACDGKLVEVA